MRDGPGSGHEIFRAFKKFLDNNKKIKTMSIECDVVDGIADIICDSDVLIEKFKITARGEWNLKNTEECLQKCIDKGKILNSGKFIELGRCHNEYISGLLQITDDNYKTILKNLKENEFTEVSFDVPDHTLSDFSKVEEIILSLPKSVKKIYFVQENKNFKSREILDLFSKLLLLMFVYGCVVMKLIMNHCLNYCLEKVLKNLLFTIFMTWTKKE